MYIKAKNICIKKQKIVNYEVIFFNLNKKYYASISNIYNYSMKNLYIRLILKRDKVYR